MKQMIAKLFKWLSLSGILIAILLLAVSPVFVSASGASMTDNCDHQQTHDSSPIPLCCMNHDIPLYNCGINNSAGTINFSFKSTRSDISNSIRISIIQLSQKGNFRLLSLQLGVIPKIPPLSNGNNCCRNSLSSEDPALV
jgi:hypothetical protein